MSDRVVEIANPAFLSVKDRQLVIARDGEVVGSLPLEDLGVLILDGHGIAHTHELLAECASRNIALVVCDSKHLPCGMLLPFEANTLAGKTVREQALCSEPAKKQLWKQIVQAKLRAQATALETERRRDRDAQTAAKDIRRFAEQVRSGDPDNLEGVAAAAYFAALFAPPFVRDRELPGINALLNYGYAVLRAMTARALVGTGLHPALAAHHKSQYNAFALADDAMEPLRPAVDRLVLKIERDGEVEDALTPSLKRRLLEITVFPVRFAGKSMPIQTALPLYAASIKRVLCAEGRRVTIPEV